MVIQHFFKNLMNGYRRVVPRRSNHQIFKPKDFQQKRSRFQGLSGSSDAEKVVAPKIAKWISPGEYSDRNG